MSVKKTICVIQNLEGNEKNGKYIAEKPLLGVSQIVMDALVKQYKGLPPFSLPGKDFSCPACGVYISFDKSKQSAKEAPCFCGTCGQRFDWGDIFDSE